MAPIHDLVERLVSALERLAALGETVEDEWTYVHDLEVVWAARLRAVAAERSAAAGADDGAPSGGGGGPAVPHAELEAAMSQLVAEAGAVTDPHRAIDWLSTLPQCALVALGETAW
ncbi:MAG: hypothetical protein HYX57_06225 [Chloroflexi bacterium]|nr:hypothetical protein [Chloroflexota bacterium]